MNKKIIAFIILITFTLGTVTVPAQASGTAPVNLALNKPATASSQNKTWEYPTNAVDGNTSTQWSSAVSQAQNWLQVDLGQEYRIGRWVVKNAGADGSNPGWNNQSYSLQVSTDGEGWQTVDNVVNNPKTVEGNVTDREFAPVMARYVRHFTTEDARVKELEIYSPSGPALPTAAGLSLTGKNVVGTTLSGSYSLFVNPEGNQEYGSTATWRRADDAAFMVGVTDIKTEPISQGITSEYTLTEADTGKYIQFSVIPRSNAAENNTGDEVSTVLFEPVRMPVTQPHVTLTSPFAGYKVHEGTPIALSAVATCDNTEIVKIEYYANDLLIAQSSEAPFDAVWEDAIPGEYAVSARAYNALVPAESGISASTIVIVYDINETIEPVWAKKWSYDFDQFTDTGVYSSGYQLPGTKPPSISYATGGTIQNAHGLFGKADNDYHFQINSTSGGTEIPRLFFPLVDLDKPIKTVVAEADVAFTTANENRYLLGYRTSLASYNMICFLNNGTIGYFNGAGSTTTPFKDENGQNLNYEINKWYRVGIKLDFEKKEVSYYLNGMELLTRPAPDPNRFEHTSEMRINGNHTTAQTGTMYVDNLFLGQVQDSYVSATITAPEGGSYHLTGSSINIKGYAKDGRDDFAVQKVEFLLDNVPFHEVSGSSFDFTKADIPPGHHTLQAKATSTDGMTGYSERVPIIVSAVQLPTMYANDMLLQRNKEIRLGGSGVNGASVTASLNGCTATAVISGGRWSLTLPPQPANKSTVLHLTTSDGVTIRFNNVAIGELILCSGQSNMQYRLEQWTKLKANADKDYPDIRLFNQSVVKVGTEQTNSPNGYWTPATVDQALRFSGMGYLTGRDYYLSQNGQVPVGLIYAAYGGEGIQFFMTPDACKYDPDISEDGNTYYKGSIAQWKYFTLGHVLWYQGEYNTHMNYPYEKALTHYIDGYREHFKDENLHFIIIQLPIYDYPGKFGGTRSGIGVREGQFNVSQRLPNVSSVVSIDTGDYGNIHPDDKMPLVHRASLALQHFTNPGNIGLLWKSPSFDRYEVEDGIMTIYFKDVGSGLKTKDGEQPRGFKLADANGVFQDVSAVLEGNTVKINVSPVTGAPKVRYAFTDAVPLNGVRSNLNLLNSADLPMAPFRTDMDKYNFLTNNGDGTYTNPINFAPTVRWIRVGHLVNGTVPITINARDYDGEITRIELYKDNVLLGEAEKINDGSYVYNWQGAIAGTYSFHAVVMDNDGTTSLLGHSSMGSKTASAQKFSLAVSPAPLYAVFFEDSDGGEITRFGSVDTVKARTNFGGTDSVLVLAAYKGNILLKAIFSEDAEAVLDGEVLTDATVVKAFVWNDYDTMQPLGEMKLLYR